MLKRIKIGKERERGYETPDPESEQRLLPVCKDRFAYANASLTQAFASINFSSL